MGSSMQRIAIKYDQAAGEFQRMQQATQELAQINARTIERTNAVAGSGWIGKDQEAYTEAIYNYVKILNEQVAAMQRVVATLIRQAQASYDAEMARAANFRRG